MKKVIYFLLMVLLSSFFIYSCNNDDTPEVKKAKLGAQDNTAAGGFYSVAENKVYTMDEGFQNQGAIDIECFYEAANGNNIAIASPGSHITGIFTGASSVVNWTTQNTTYFTKTTLTVEQFDSAENDSLLVTGYKPQNVSGLCKFCYTGKIIPFKTAGGKYGMVKVIRADEQEGGSMEIAVKIQQ